MARLAFAVVVAVTSALDVHVQVQKTGSNGRYMPADATALPAPARISTELALVFSMYAGLHVARGPKAGNALILAGWLGGRLYGAFMETYAPGFGPLGNVAMPAISVFWTRAKRPIYAFPEGHAAFREHLAKTREAMDELMRSGTKRQEIARFVKIAYATRDGGSVGVHFFVPFPSPQRDSTCPLVVYYHGGAFALGSAYGYENNARRMANDVGAIVALVDYRRSPEHKFPTAHQDALDGLLFAHEWCQSDARCDHSRVAVAGDSAGGHLAAVTAKTWLFTPPSESGAGSLSVHPLPKLKAQVLLNPLVVPYTAPYPSTVRRAADPVVGNGLVAWTWSTYLADPLTDVSNPRANPTLDEAVVWKNVPPAVVVTGHFDPLADEGLAYAEHLASHDVTVHAAHRLEAHTLFAEDTVAWVHASLKALLDDTEVPKCC